MSDELELKMVVASGGRYMCREDLWSRFQPQTGTKGSLPGVPRLRQTPAACANPLVPVPATNRDQRSK